MDINHSNTELLSKGVRFYVDKELINGNGKLSYTKIIQLAESCREYHWDKDITPIISNDQIDVTCVSLEGDFSRPILVEQHIRIEYSIEEIGKKSYIFFCQFLDESAGDICCWIKIKLVFVDLKTKHSIIPSGEVYCKLLSLKKPEHDR